MRCKPGDLAIIVSCPEFPENLGGWVHVLERSNLEGDDWRCEALQHFRVYAGFTERIAAPGEDVHAQDCQLWPVRGQTASGEKECEKEHSKETECAD